MVLRQLLYISEAKLNQFVEDKRIPGWRAGSAEAELSVLEIVRLKLTGTTGDKDSVAQRQQQLLGKAEKVLQSIERSDFPAVWYEDSAEVGRWIQFEARMCALRYKDLCVFSTQIEPSPRVVLILHGSSWHLTRPYDEKVMDPTQIMSERKPFMHRLRQLLNGDDLTRRSVDSAYSDVDPGLPEDGLRLLRREFGLGEIGLASGFAVVTGSELHILDGQEYRVTFGSPLYVERTTRV